jgi:hypothetical protein
MNNFVRAQLAIFSLAILSGGLNSNAYASTAGAVTVANSAGAPGSIVTPIFTLDFGQSLQLINFNFNWEFDPQYLTFRKDISTISYGGMEMGPAAFIDLIKTKFGSNAQTTGGHTKFDYTIFSGGFESAEVFGQAVIKTAFELSANTPLGYATEVSFAGNLVDVDENEIPFAANATIQAIPEPQLWMLWLSGMAIVVLRAMRRRNSAFISA